jgi:hypothetical protein
MFLGWLFHSERNIAERLSALSKGPPPWSGIVIFTRFGGHRC